MVWRLANIIRLPNPFRVGSLIVGPPRSSHQTAQRSSKACHVTSRVPCCCESAPYLAELVVSSCKTRATFRQTLALKKTSGPANLIRCGAAYGLVSLWRTSLSKTPLLGVRDTKSSARANASMRCESLRASCSSFLNVPFTIDWITVSKLPARWFSSCIKRSFSRWFCKSSARVVRYRWLSQMIREAAKA